MTPADTLIMAMVHRAGPGRGLASWLAARQCEGYAVDWDGSPDYLLDAARNQMLARFLERHPDRRFVVMLDSDMVPVDATDPLLTAPGDLVWCGYTGRALSHGHHARDGFGAGCFRASRELLERMARPWFKFDMGPDHDQKIDCECQWFAARARAVGCSPEQVGVVGHRTEVVTVPGPDGRPLLLPLL